MITNAWILQASSDQQLKSFEGSNRIGSALVCRLLESISGGHSLIWAAKHLQSGPFLYNPDISRRDLTSFCCKLIYLYSKRKSGINALSDYTVTRLLEVLAINQYIGTPVQQCHLLVSHYRVNTVDCLYFTGSMTRISDSVTLSSTAEHWYHGRIRRRWGLKHFHEVSIHTPSLIPDKAQAWRKADSRRAPKIHTKGAIIIIRATISYSNHSNKPLWQPRQRHAKGFRNLERTGRCSLRCN